MKNNLRRILSLTVALILICGLSVTASAGGGPEYPVRDDVQEDVIQREQDTPDDSTAENAPSVQTPTTSTTQKEDSAPLTPEGNMTLVDDVESETEENKQFITVVTKDGNYFYIIIDRAADGENTVHFLNQVDEEDLLALMETEQKEETPIVCSCTEKCAIGSIKIDCEICMTQMDRCVGKESEPVIEKEPEKPDPEPESEPEKKSYTGALLVVVLVMTGIGAGVFYLLVLKPKKRTNAPDPLEDLDLEEYYEETEDSL
jgi:hypothetical protein